MKHPKPSGCPGTYKWLVCRYCPNLQECGEQSVREFTWRPQTRHAMRRALAKEVPSE